MYILRPGEYFKARCIFLTMPGVYFKQCRVYILRPGVYFNTRCIKEILQSGFKLVNKDITLQVRPQCHLGSFLIAVQVYPHSYLNMHFYKSANIEILLFKQPQCILHKEVLHVFTTFWILNAKVLHISVYLFGNVKTPNKCVHSSDSLPLPICLKTYLSSACKFFLICSHVKILCHTIWEVPYNIYSFLLLACCNRNNPKSLAISVHTRVNKLICHDCQPTNHLIRQGYNFWTNKMNKNTHCFQDIELVGIDPQVLFLWAHVVEVQGCGNPQNTTRDPHKGCSLETFCEVRVRALQQQTFILRTIRRIISKCACAIFLLKIKLIDLFTSGYDIFKSKSS